MSKELPDGSIAPKYFSQHDPVISAQSETSLRMGTISKAYYPDASGNGGNVNGVSVEYDVLVDYVDYRGSYSKVPYSRCKVLSTFGGAADFTFNTHRQSTISPSQIDTLNTGSIVLVLCVNSDLRQGIIIGGLPHNLLNGNPNFKKYALASGKNYIWEFNGALINVDDAGELSLAFTGPTQDDGSPLSTVDTGNNLTYLRFASDGAAIINTGNNFVLIGNNGGNTQNTNSNIIKINAASTININAGDGNINLTAGENAGVQTGAATDYTMLGTTYRKNEAALHNFMSSDLADAATDLATAGTALTTLGSSLTSSAILSPLAAAFGTIGGLLLQAGLKINGVAEDIQNFEDDADEYLSIRNKSD